MNKVVKEVKILFNLSITDYKILKSIRDKDKDTGYTQLKSTTKKTISEKTQFSDSTIARSLVKLLKCGYIDEGIKQGRNKAYYITIKGKEWIAEINGQLNKDNGGDR